MANIRWGPWSGACRRSARGHRLPPSTHSTWSLDDDLGQLQKVSYSTTHIISSQCYVQVRDGR